AEQHQQELDDANPRLEGSFEPLYYPVRGQADAPLNHNLFTQNSGHPRSIRCAHRASRPGLRYGCHCKAECVAPAASQAPFGPKSHAGPNEAGLLTCAEVKPLAAGMSSATADAFVLACRRQVSEHVQSGRQAASIWLRFPCE
ncbi:hypothetical protein, partial [Caballeronia arationis]|uniref:hypothetical protein n=1 Tax=Caballeronia arationis TaxID=1777142 RepID=UPI001F2B4E42